MSGYGVPPICCERAGNLFKVNPQTGFVVWATDTGHDSVAVAIDEHGDIYEGGGPHLFHTITGAPGNLQRWEETGNSVEQVWVGQVVPPNTQGAGPMQLATIWFGVTSQGVPVVAATLGVTFYWARDDGQLSSPATPPFFDPIFGFIRPIQFFRFPPQEESHFVPLPGISGGRFSLPRGIAPRWF